MTLIVLIGKFCINKRRFTKTACFFVIILVHWCWNYFFLFIVFFYFLFMPWRWYYKLSDKQCLPSSIWNRSAPMLGFEPSTLSSWGSFSLWLVTFYRCTGSSYECAGFLLSSLRLMQPKIKLTTYQSHGGHSTTLSQQGRTRTKEEMKHSSIKILSWPVLANSNLLAL